MSKRVLKLLTLSVCLLMLSASNVLAEDPVYFADANLKAAVENELGISDPTPTDMLALTVLNASDRAISDLTGIEYASNLTNLNLDDNQIRDISALSGLTNLTHLRLNGNMVDDISVLSDLMNLEWLFLASNKISDISALSGLTSLTDLNLGNNQISDITILSGLTNLFIVALDRNQISDISALSGLTGLAMLDLRSNPLNLEAYCIYLPLIENNNHCFYDPNPYPPEACVMAEDPVYFADANLKTAVEEELGITDPTPTDMRSLTALGAVYRGISDLTGIEYASNLTELYLERNPISDISSLSGLTNLTHLDLNYNWAVTNDQISDISPLSGLTNLTWLGLMDNHVSDISALSDLTNLTVLYLNENQISDISPLSGLINLTELYLGFNQISDISPLSGLINLTWLSLGDNPISDISALSGLSSLTVLGLRDNQISDISPLSGLTNLTELYLDNNQISDISALSGLTNLTKLNLDDNQISDISALSEFTNLWLLDLRSNPLNVEAYCTYLPLIEDNIDSDGILYDPNPYPPEDCPDDDGVSDGLFSIEGTKWGECVIYLGTYAPFMNIECPSEDFTGFFQGTVYGCSSEDYCMTLEGSSYTDLQMVSIFTLNRVHSNLFGILYPSGVGIVTHFVNSFGPTIPAIRLMVGVMYKVDDNFIPLGPLPPPQNQRLSKDLLGDDTKITKEDV